MTFEIRRIESATEVAAHAGQCRHADTPARRHAGTQARRHAGASNTVSDEAWNAARRLGAQQSMQRTYFHRTVFFAFVDADSVTPHR